MSSGQMSSMIAVVKKLLPTLRANKNINVRLPRDIILLILQYFDIRDLLELRTVCKEWKVIVSCVKEITNKRFRAANPKILSLFPNLKEINGVWSNYVDSMRDLNYRSLTIKTFHSKVFHLHGDGILVVGLPKIILFRNTALVMDLSSIDGCSIDRAIRIVLVNRGRTLIFDVDHAEKLDTSKLFPKECYTDTFGGRKEISLEKAEKFHITINNIVLNGFNGFTSSKKISELGIYVEKTQDETKIEYVPIWDIDPPKFHSDLWKKFEKEIEISNNKNIISMMSNLNVESVVDVSVNRILTNDSGFLLYTNVNSISGPNTLHRIKRVSLFRKQ